jgi:hypothetical protein
MFIRFTHIAYTKTLFDANFLEPDAKLDEYREVRAAGVR